DERGNVLHLARRGIRGRVATLSASAAVVGVDGEMPCEQRRELRRRAKGPAAERAVHEYQRRAIAGPLVGDRGSVLRPDLTHGWLRSRQGRNARSRESCTIVCICRLHLPVERAGRRSTNSQVEGSRTANPNESVA